MMLDMRASAGTGLLATVTADDVPRLVAFINRAYRGSGTLADWSTEAGYISGSRTTEALLREDLAAKPDACFLKWEEEGSLRGCVWLEPLGDGVWYLGSLAVDPGLQNGGRGKILLAEAERWVRGRGGRRIRMTVINIRDVLIAWYVRRGYVETGQTEPFPYGDDRYGVPQRDDLSFVVLEKALDR